MTPISATHEVARRFNEEEAIWQRFQEKRLKRPLEETDSPIPESVLDHFDWLEAEREIRITSAVTSYRTPKEPRPAARHYGVRRLVGALERSDLSPH